MTAEHETRSIGLVRRQFLAAGVGAAFGLNLGGIAWRRTNLRPFDRQRSRAEPLRSRHLTAVCY
jgi:hypothetical protein